MKITKQVQDYILENMDLIRDGRWEEFKRQRMPNGTWAAIRAAGIDPIPVLGYIPHSYFNEDSSITEYPVPTYVKKIEARAFRRCMNLERVILPPNLRSIDDDAFYECINLKELILPKSLKSIGLDAFACCPKLHIIYEGTPGDWMKIQGSDNIRRTITFRPTRSGKGVKTSTVLPKLYKIKDSDRTLTVYPGKKKLSVRFTLTKYIRLQAPVYFESKEDAEEFIKKTQELDIPYYPMDYDIKPARLTAANLQFSKVMTEAGECLVQRYEANRMNPEFIIDLDYFDY